MKHLKLIFVALWLLISMVFYAQKSKYSIMFYNVENLFDTQKSEGVYDEEFTPEGPNKWDDKKYWEKIGHTTEVFQKVGVTTGAYPILIGLCEIENRTVLQDLTHGQRVAAAKYQIVHYDSPEPRGMDVAFLYRSDVIEYVSSKPIRVTLPDDASFKTRDILWFTGKIQGETFHFFTNHWPSRRGGDVASAPKREAAAAILRNVVDSLNKADANAKVIIMGDLNDDPNNNSVENVLGAKGKIKNLAENDLFNPMYALWKDGYGTLAYRDSWNLFDNMIVSQNLINQDKDKFQLYKPDKGNYYGFIFNKPFLIQQEGRYKGYPWRTFVGNTYQGGYSDHFPVYIYIAK